MENVQIYFFGCKIPTIRYSVKKPEYFRSDDL